MGKKKDPKHKKFCIFSTLTQNHSTAEITQICVSTIHFYVMIYNSVLIIDENNIYNQLKEDLPYSYLQIFSLMKILFKFISLENFHSLLINQKFKKLIN